MRAKEFINLMEYINKDVMSLGFSDEQSVLDNKFIIKAETISGSGPDFAGIPLPKFKMLAIEVVDAQNPEKVVATAKFKMHGALWWKNLQARMINVVPDYRRQGIATAVYQYVSKLGNTIKPSNVQLTPGQEMWKGFKRKHSLDESGMAEDPISEAGTSLDFMHGGNVVKQRVYQTMADAGYKKVGRGADASVWVKDAGSVIKIITSGQTPFLKFYKFCRAHADNPHLPRFVPIQGQDHAVFKLYGAKFLQVSMEKLQKIRNNSPQEFLVWYLEDAAKNNTSWDKVVTELTANQGSKLWKHSNQFPMETLQTIYKTLTKTPDRWLPLYKTIVALRKHTGSASWDLHTDNAMRRSDGTVVITDPSTD
jgi:hypothetical protein